MSLTQRKFRENWNWKKALEAVFLCVLVTSTFLLISLYSVSLFYSLMNIEQRIHFSLFLLFCSFILLLNEVFHEISTRVFLEYSDDSLIFLSVLRLSLVSQIIKHLELFVVMVIEFRLMMMIQFEENCNFQEIRLCFFNDFFVVVLKEI